MERFLWLVPALPLAGAILNGLKGRRWPEKTVATIACAGPIAAFVLSCLAYKQVFANPREPIVVDLFQWFSAGGLTVDVVLRADALSILMMLVVTGVGSLIHLYSAGYMHGEKGFARYYAYLNLFTFAMLVLVMADDLLVMFVGWEGVGLCSYLLIGFWYDDIAKADAGKKAFIVNRIGDLGFILGIFFLYSAYGTTSVTAMREAGAPDAALLLAPALLLFVGACGKSAQIPLYVWLPDAMAGPTPVSALIHAATMVTAGVYMVCRMNFVYSLVPAAQATIGVVGAATALLAGLIAVGQNDIKKVLAYSTVSQLGYMFCGAAAGGYFAAMFHLTTHAFFKALLFLGAGAVIHALHGEQDLRKMGGLWKKIPLVCGVFLVGTLAMAGPLCGMWSKDEILEAVHIRHTPLWTAVWGMLLVTAMLTSFYVWRLFVMAFAGEARAEHHDVHKPGSSMGFALVVLAGLSLTGNLYSTGIQHWLSSTWTTARAHIAAEGHINLYISLAAAVAGPLIAFASCRRVWSANPLLTLLENKFYVDEIYERVIVWPLKMASALMWLIVDKLLIDGLIVNGVPRVVYSAALSLRQGHPGAVNMGVGAILIGVLVVLIYVVWSFKIQRI